MKTRPLDPFAASLTLALCVLWGFNQVVARSCSSTWRPIAQTVRCVGRSGGVRLCPSSIPRRRGGVSASTARKPPARSRGFFFTARVHRPLRIAVLDHRGPRHRLRLRAAPFFVALGAVFLLKERAAAPDPVVRPRARLSWRCRRSCRPLTGRRSDRTRWRCWRPRRGARRPSSLRRRRCAGPIRRRCCSIRWHCDFDRAFRGCCVRRASARASLRRDDRCAPLAGRRGGGPELCGVVLVARALSGASALGLHLRDPARRRFCRLARRQRGGDPGIRGRDSARRRGRRAGQLAAASGLLGQIAATAIPASARRDRRSRDRRRRRRNRGTRSNREPPRCRR